MAGSAVGADNYAQEQFAEAEEKQRVSQLFNPTQFNSYKEVEGFGDFTRFAAETIGEQFGNLGVTLGAALAAPVALPSAVGLKTAQLVGAGFGSYALNAPEVFENIYSETGETAPGTALIFGAGAAALDSILPAALARNISGPMKAGIVTKILERSGMKPGVLRSGTAGLFSGLGIEGITEGAQEGVSIAAERFIDDNPDVFGSKEFDRIMEASVRGAVAGGGFGTVGGSIEGAREGAQRSQRLQDLTEARELRDKINTTVEEAFDKQQNEFGDALETAEENASQAQEAKVKEAVKTQPKTSAEIFQDDATQFDAFGQPIQVDITEVAKFTKPQVQQEARRRARNNNTKVSDELKIVRAEIKTAKDTIATQEKERKAVLKTQEKERKVEVKNEAIADAEFKTARDAFVSEPTEPSTLIPTDKAGIQAWNKQNLNIGTTAGILREDNALAGKDISDPAQALEVRAILESFASDKSDATISKVETYLARPEFQVAIAETTDVAPVAAPVAAPVTAPVAAPVTAPVAAPVIAEVGGVLSDAEIVAGSNEVNPLVNANQTTDQTTDQTIKVDEVVSLDKQNLGKPIETFRGTLQGQENTKFNVYKTSNGFVTEITRPNAIKGQPPVVSRTEHKNKKQVDATKSKMVDRIGVLTSVSNDNVFNRPAYKGKALNREQRRTAERGNFKQLLNRLVSSQPKEIQQILRKISSQGLTTKLVVGATPEGTSGYYDASTDTIVLNPKEGVFSGLTEETFLHETSHAALAQALNNPDLQITKDFTQFFIEVKDQMGGMYGGTTLQEFAAELVSNPEFQALLKDTRAPKAPAGKNMWTRMMESILRFFGFRPQQTAYAKGLDFIDKILDVSQGVEPTLADRLFLGTPDVGVKAIAQVMNSGKPLTGKKKEEVLNALSKLDGKSGLRATALRAFRLQDFIRMFGEKIPSIKDLQRALLSRQGAIEKAVLAVQENYRKFRKLVQKSPTQSEELNDIAQEATLDEFDLVGLDGDRFNASKLTPEKRSRYEALQTRFNRLDPQLKEMYKTIRKEYLDSFYGYRDGVLDQVANKNKREELKKDFDKQHPLVGYVPQLRFGEYMLDYTDANGRIGFTGFNTPRERTEFIKNNNLTDVNSFDKVDGTSTSDIPASDTFIAKLLNELPSEVHEQVRDTHFSFFPDSSFMQRFRKRRKDASGRGIVGGSKDLTKVYGNTMVKWAQKKNNLKYLPEIEAALTDIGKSRDVGATGLEAAVRDEITKNRGAFMRNPTYPKLTAFFATGAYNLFLTGNVSAAIVNLSAIPMLSLPILAGPFGFGKANASLLQAMKIASPFGRGKLNKDTGTIRNPDWVDMPRYKNLVAQLDAVGQREHTLQREVTEGARQSTQEYTGFMAKVMSYASIPFTEAEKYSRGVTAIAAYELAKQKKPPGKQYEGMTNEQAAAEYAVNTVIDVHTSGMAAEGPSVVQHPIGRVIFTFKTFIWNSAIVIAYAMKQAGMFRPIGIDGATNEQGNPDVEARRIAGKQVIGIYGMSAAVAGVNGLPFFGATATLVNIINSILGDEDEPFNFRDVTRDFTGQLAFKGPINYATNTELSNRVGLANGLLFKEDPYSIEEDGYILTAISQAMGPVGSYMLGAERALLEGGRKEMLFPSAIRNPIKAYRFAVEGATNKNGDPIISDLSAYSLALQAFGFGSAELSEIYEVRSAALNFENKVTARISEIKADYIIAKDTGDFVGALEATQEMNDMRLRHPDKIDGGTLERSYKATKAYRKRVVNGVVTDKNINNPYLDQLLLLD